jgi:hypothetical protein
MNKRINKKLAHYVGHCTVSNGNMFTGLKPLAFTQFVA